MPPNQPTRVLAIDPSLRSTGFAILECVGGGKIRALRYGTIRNNADLRHSSCLVAIHDRLAEMIHEFEPDSSAVECVIYVQSYRTAIALGSARGAANVQPTSWSRWSDRRR